ncbi:MAG: ferrochelatase [Deltaproteobacteria bacterium]|nr:ferrochelatase [Deltaproteobacteria bacterium]
MEIHPSSLIPHPSDSIAVLLLAFGGPEKLDDVEPFLRNILVGRAITPELVERVKRRYELIGGKSPLPEITRNQARLLEERLNSLSGTVPILRHDKAVSVNRDSPLFKVYVGMRHWHPFIKDTVKQIKEEGIKRIIAVPMAPQASKASTGGYIDAMNKALEEVSGIIDVTVAEALHNNLLYLQAVVDTVKDALKEFPEERRMDVQVIFSAHSLPKRTVEGDPYEMQMKETMAGVLNIIGPINSYLAYQSKGQAPGEWLGPEVESVMEGLAKEGKKDVLIVPIGFVCDHVETLYDIDIVFKKKAEGLGMNFKRAASLNDSKAFIEALADIVKKNL